MDLAVQIDREGLTARPSEGAVVSGERTYRSDDVDPMVDVAWSRVEQFEVSYNGDARATILSVRHAEGFVAFAVAEAPETVRRTVAETGGEVPARLLGVELPSDAAQPVDARSGGAEAAGSAASAGEERRRLVSRANQLRTGLVMVGALIVVASLLMVALASAGQPADRPLALMAAYGAVATAYALCFVVTAVLWLRWQSSVHAVYEPTSQSRIWWWLVPVANLALPYKAVRELADEARVELSAGVLAGWWTAVVVAVVAHIHIDTTFGFNVFAVTAPPDLRGTELVVRAVGILSVPVAAALAWKIVGAFDPVPPARPLSRRRGRGGFAVTAIVGLVVGAFVVDLAYWGPREAQAAVDSYIEAARAHDAYSMFRTVHPLLREHFNEQDAQRAFADAPPLPPLEPIDITEEQIDGETATVVILGATVDGVEAVAVFTVLNDDYEWKIAGITVNVPTFGDVDIVRDIGAALGMPADLLGLPPA